MLIAELRGVFGFDGLCRVELGWVGFGWVSSIGLDTYRRPVGLVVRA